MARITVLLATYNGSKYVRQMVDSVLAQDFGDFHLVLSDDGSRDDTPQILDEYAAMHPGKVTHYRSGTRFGNAQNHFMHLLQQFHDTPYIMFCDQDDYWHPDKISKTLQKMQRTEKPGLPTLVHTDLRVVDGALQEMDPSFMHFSKLQGERLQLNKLLVQNVVTGCTVMLNKPLAELACSHMPQGKILMHDWWLALIAAAMGTAAYLPESTIDYRQHGNNTVGAKNTRSASYIFKKIKNDGVKTAMAQTFVQAKTFLDCFGALLTPENRALVAAYAAMPEKKGLARRVDYLKYGFLKCGLTRIAAQLLWG